MADFIFGLIWFLMGVCAVVGVGCCVLYCANENVI